MAHTINASPIPSAEVVQPVRVLLGTHAARGSTGVAGVAGGGPAKSEVPIKILIEQGKR